MSMAELIDSVHVRIDVFLVVSLSCETSIRQSEHYVLR